MRFIRQTIEQTGQGLTFRIRCAASVVRELWAHGGFAITENTKRDASVYAIRPSLDDIKDGEEFTMDDIETKNLITTIFKGTHTSLTMMLASVYLCVEKACGEIRATDHGDCSEVIPDGCVTDITVTGTEEQWHSFCSKCKDIYAVEIAGLVADAIGGDSKD